MGVKPRYDPERKKWVIAALQVMIDNLSMKLQISDKVSFDLDTEESHRKTFELCGEPPVSPERLRQSVEEARDRSIGELGHIQKRLAEVKTLKEAFESSKVPSPEILSRTYRALRSSLILETMGLCLFVPSEQIFGEGLAGVGKEKMEEIHQHGRSVQIYSNALFFGFRVSPFFWNEFPFDD